MSRNSPMFSFEFFEAKAGLDRRSGEENPQPFAWRGRNLHLKSLGGSRTDVSAVVEDIFDNFLGVLSQPRHGENQYTAQYPAHDAEYREYEPLPKFEANLVRFVKKFELLEFDYGQETIETGAEAPQ